MTCICCKLLESIVVSDLLQYLNNHNLINKCQHGFLRKHSCLTNLLESCRDWTVSLSNHKSVVIGSIDFQKAFDTVSHSKLLHKLIGYGIQGNLLLWISSFLSNRTQRVRIGTSFSDTCPVPSGIPQGSVVGPLLFNLFINDLPDNLNSSAITKLFADDVTIYTCLSDVDSCSDFQRNLSSIQQWSNTWQLSISTVKSSILLLGKGSNDFFLSGAAPINVVDNVRSLGITLDRDLNFKLHIHEIVTKAKRSSALIFRCFLSRQINSLTSAFKTYVRPLVEYSSQIWSPYSIQLVMMIENVQRSFTKRLPCLFNFSYCDRLQFLGLQSLEHRRLLADLTLCYKIIHGLIALDFNDFFTLPVHPGLRGHSFKLTVPIVKCNRSKFFFVQGCPSLECFACRSCHCA